MRKSIQLVLTLLLCAVVMSCENQPTLKDAKQKVFGNLTLGATQEQFSEELDSLYKANALLVNENGRPYFRMVENAGLETELLFYPLLPINPDSLVNEIRYYVYSFDITNYDPSLINDDNRKYFIQNSLQDGMTLGAVKSSFSLNIESGKQIDGFFPPMTMQVDGQSANLAGEIITKLLNEKYGEGIVSTIGNYKDPSSDFLREITWKTENIDVTFTKIYPATESSPRFLFQVLTYRYNDTFRKKHRLIKEPKDIKNSF